MALNLTPDESPTSQPGTDTGYGQAPVGQGKEDCKKKAEEGGGVTWDEHAQACWKIFGKAVIIGDDEHSIQEGFEVVNFNFHANGNQPAVPTQGDLPGDAPQSQGLGSFGYGKGIGKTAYEPGV